MILNMENKELEVRIMRVNKKEKNKYVDAIKKLRLKKI